MKTKKKNKNDEDNDPNTFFLYESKMKNIHSFHLDLEHCGAEVLKTLNDLYVYGEGERTKSVEFMHALVFFNPQHCVHFFFYSLFFAILRYDLQLYTTLHSFT